MSDPEEKARSQRPQQDEAAVEDALDSALAHDRARETAIDEGVLENLASDVNDRET